MTFFIEDCYIVASLQLYSYSIVIVYWHYLANSLPLHWSISILHKAIENISALIQKIGFTVCALIIWLQHLATLLAMANSYSYNTIIVILACFYP